MNTNQTTPPTTAQRVLAWFAENGPATYHALAEGTGLGLDHARVTCCELDRLGQLRRVGKQETRTRPRTLWAVAQEA